MSTIIYPNTSKSFSSKVTKTKKNIYEYMSMKCKGTETFGLSYGAYKNKDTNELACYTNGKILLSSVRYKDNLIDCLVPIESIIDTFNKNFSGYDSISIPEDFYKYLKVFKPRKTNINLRLTIKNDTIEINDYDECGCKFRYNDMSFNIKTELNFSIFYFDVLKIKKLFYHTEDNKLPCLIAESYLTDNFPRYTFLMQMKGVE